MVLLFLENNGSIDQAVNEYEHHLGHLMQPLIFGKSATVFRLKKQLRNKWRKYV